VTQSRSLVAEVWQSLQVASACAPVSGKRVRRWRSRMLVSRQVVGVWHSAQRAPSRPMCASSAAWHETHADLVSTPVRWQLTHPWSRWLPTSGKPVFA
jgi:hypothetical protein